MHRSLKPVALCSMALLGACALSTERQGAGPEAVRVAQRGGTIPCSTTDIGIATVSRCGSSRTSLGVAGE